MIQCDTVKEIGKIAIRGNIIHDAWYKTITRQHETTLKQGDEIKRISIEKPYMDAILCLSDIVNYFQPINKIDENGKEYETQKFPGLRLARPALRFANKFGISEKRARTALDFLEKDKGVISIELEEVVSVKDGKKKLMNTIDINVKIFKELTEIDIEENENKVVSLENQPLPKTASVAENGTPPENGKSTPPENGKTIIGINNKELTNKEIGSGKPSQPKKNGQEQMDTSAPTPKSPPPYGKKKLTKAEREFEFKKSLKPYAEKYPRTMLIEFANYWTESNPKGRKLKFEMQKVFDISRRLATWYSKSNGKYDKPQVVSIEGSPAYVAYVEKNILPKYPLMVKRLGLISEDDLTQLSQKIELFSQKRCTKSTAWKLVYKCWEKLNDKPFLNNATFLNHTIDYIKKHAA